MELTHDWRSFGSLFHPRPRLGARRLGDSAAPPSAPIRIITEKGVLLAVLGEPSEDFSGWMGRKLVDFVSHYREREVFNIDRKEVEAKLMASLQLPHFYDQCVFLRENVKPARVHSEESARGKANGRRSLESAVDHGHFLLDGIQGWWAKILPSAYGLLIRLEPGVGATANPGDPNFNERGDVFILIRRGQLKLCHSPDLSSLGPDRARQMGVAVKHLSERHGVPVQGFVASARDWAEWSFYGTAGSALPGDYKESWKKLALSIQSNEAQLIPFRWQAMTLIATRAFLGL